MKCCNKDCRQGRNCPAHVELITDKAERVIFLLLAIVAAVFLYLE